jgi:hypothetical protein
MLISLISSETDNLWLSGSMPLTLLDFFFEVRHIDNTRRMITMNKPTISPINSHASNPKTDVFFDNLELRSDAI